MSQNFLQEPLCHSFSNGLNLIVQPIRDVHSLAFSILIPTGIVREPENLSGLASLTTEALMKGAAGMNAVELSNECEKIGFHRSISCGMENVCFSGNVLSENFKRALELTRDIILFPEFPASELESLKSLALHDLEALEDEPASKVIENLTKEFYPYPYSRSSIGTKEGIQKTTNDDLIEFYKKTFGARGAVIGVCGNVDPQLVIKHIEELFSSWGGGLPLLDISTYGSQDKSFYYFKDNAQVQIALAYPSVKLDEPLYYAGRVAMNVLSGGMSGRLFVEVREKRGLVYRVGAHHSISRDRSAVFAYAGTTPENAEETLKVMLEQLNSLSDGVSPEELLRAKVDLKTRIIMQGESTSARASILSTDWWNLTRIRSLDEVKQAIDSVSEDDIVRFSKQYPVRGVTLAVLGNKEVKL